MNSTLSVDIAARLMYLATFSIADISSLSMDSPACTKSTIINNNIYDNTKFNLQLGEFHKEDINLSDNWWGSADKEEIFKKIYDKEDDNNLGKVFILPQNEIIGNIGVK